MDAFFRCSMRKLSQLFIIKKRSDKLKQLGYESFRTTICLKKVENVNSL